MTQRSRFWDGTTDGDATEAPYDASLEFAYVLMSLGGAGTVPNYRSGVFDGLVPSVSAGQVLVTNGRALVLGTWYESDTTVTIPIPLPSGGNRPDRIVLRKDWTAKTARLVQVQGVVGGGYPAPTNVLGDKWDMPLFSYVVTPAGAIVSSVDDRAFLPYLTVLPHMTGPGLPNVVEMDQLRKPVCSVTTAPLSFQSVTQNLLTTLNFGQLTYKYPTTMHNVAAPSRITVDRAGVYNVSAIISWDGGNDTGQYTAYVTKNGSAAGIVQVDLMVEALILPDSGRQSRSQIIPPTPVVLAANDYLEIKVLHDTGTGVRVGGNIAPIFSVEWIGPNV